MYPTCEGTRTEIRDIGDLRDFAAIIAPARFCPKTVTHPSFPAALTRRERSCMVLPPMVNEMTAASRPIQIDRSLHDGRGRDVAPVVDSQDAGVFFAFGYDYAWRWYFSTRWAVS